MPRKKLHWTQTPEGKKRLKAIMKKSWGKRRGKKQESESDPTKFVNNSIHELINRLERERSVAEERVRVLEDAICALERLEAA